MIDRRTLLGAMGATLLPVPSGPAGAARLAALEANSGGRLGVMALDTATGRRIGWRADERFAHCSTFKLSLAALALREIEAGRARGDEVVAYSIMDVLPHSPITEANAANERMSLVALAEAAVVVSDNLAANLLLARFGGPAGLTRFWRDIGDPVSRLDHTEPALNRVAPGELHDTTTPAAMTADLARMLIGTVLPPAARAMLWGWMKRCETGLYRLRAGLPAGWQAGDKTGTWWNADEVAKVNDMAILLAPVGDRHFSAPIAVGAWFEPGGRRETIRPADEAVLAEVARIVTDPVSWRLRR